MIQEAQAHHAYDGIEYQVFELDAYAYPKDTYDVVISNLVLHHIEDLKKIYQQVYQTLKKDGVFLFNIEHPLFTSGVQQDWIYDENGTPLYWPIDRYFYTGERETKFLGQKVIKQHHTLTQILNGLLECGFCIETVEEAQPSQEMLSIPGMKDELRRPMMLLVKAVK